MAFAQYDSGAKIEEVQDLDVIYDMKDQLDAQGIYDHSHVNRFRVARFRRQPPSNADSETEHKAMYAANQEPTTIANRSPKPPPRDHPEC